MLVALRRALKRGPRAARNGVAPAKVEDETRPASFIKSPFLDIAFEPSEAERSQVVSSKAQKRRPG
jgi:hypothetical protein